MYTSIVNPKNADGTPNTVMQTQYEERLYNSYTSKAVLTKYQSLFPKRVCANGQDSVTFSLRGEGTNDTTSSIKLAGDLPKQVKRSTLNINGTYDASEKVDQVFDNETYGDARWQMALTDAQLQMSVEIDNLEKRVMHMLYKTAKTAGVTGYIDAPTVVNEAGAGSSDPTLVFTYNDAGAEKLYKDVVKLKLAMGTNRRVGPHWLLVIRPDVAAALKFGNRTSNIQYNPTRDMSLGTVPSIEGLAMLEVPSQYWPSSNYVDQSFSRYNINATYNGGNAQPVAYILNFGEEFGPLAEVVPPVNGGMNVKMIEDPIREATIVRVSSRATYVPFVQSCVGAISFSN